jgi:hypothetical protein
MTSIMMEILTAIVRALEFPAHRPGALADNTPLGLNSIVTA